MMGIVLPNRAGRGDVGSACVGKRKYGTEGSALLGAKYSEGRMRRRCKKAAKPINVYLCRFCHLWHLTRSDR